MAIVRIGTHTSIMALAICSAMASPAMAQGRQYHFNLSVMPLDRALLEIARISHSQVLFDRDVVAGRFATSLSGDFTVEQALVRVTGGSGVAITRGASGGFLVKGANIRPIAQVTDPSVGQQLRTNDAATDSLSSGSAENGDVVVTGTRAALESVERTKRDSNVLIDGISADDIGALPDVSIGDSIVRIPGVTANDNQEGFDQVSVRGLGPDLTQTSFNGRPLATPGAGARRFPVGDLPTEGIGAAYVQKTPDAASMEGGLAGTIDLQSIHPLDTRRHGLTLVGRALLDDISDKVGDAYNFHKVGYRAEATYIGRFGDNLGVALTYAHISQTNVSPGIQFDGYKTRTGAGSDLDGNGILDAIPGNAGINIGASTQNRDSVLGTVQWSPTSSLRLTLDGLYVKNYGNQNATRFFAANNAAAGRAVPTSSTVVDDTVVALQGDNQAGLYQIVENNTHSDRRQFESGLNVAFDNGGPIKFNVDGYYTSAIADSQTRQVQFQNTAANATAQAEPFGYAFNGTSPTLNFAELGASNFVPTNIDLGTSHNSDKIMGVGANFSYRADIPFIKSIQFGYRVDGRANMVRPDDVVYTPKNFASRVALNDDFLYSGENPFAPFASRLGGESAVSFPLYNVNYIAADVGDPRFVADTKEANDLAGYSKINETTYALYGQANLLRGPLSGNIGVRWFNTDQTVQGLLGQTFATAIPQNVRHSYQFLLPSLNLRYELTHSLIGRFALSKTVSRPTFGDLQVGSNVDLSSIANTVLTINRGNPDLLPFTAKNIDASVEWYPNSHMSFAVQGFFNAVTNFIEDSTESGTVTLEDGTLAPVVIQSSANDPNIRHFYGVEVIARRDFSFLPGFLSNTGLRLDYSHNWTNATATANSVVVGTDSTPAIVPPNNFEPDILNGQLYYSARSIDLHLAYRYYSRYFRSAFNAYQSHPGGQLDLSGSVAVRRGIRLIGTIVNLTQTKDIQYFADKRNSDDSSQLLRSVSYNGRTFTLGIRANF